MARIARIVLKDIPFHITQRGNSCQQVFFEAADYALYLDLLRESAKSNGLSVWAYCLMPNHVHIVGVPRRLKAMAETLSRTHADYAKHFNLSRRSCGHVWQARYFSCPLDEGHLWNAMAYVERNPVRARMVTTAEEYRWSSARARLTGDAEFPDLTEWRRRFTAEQWRQVLQTSIDEEAWGRRLAEASRRGRPFGDVEFAAELERRAGRVLLPRRAGRPRRGSDREDGEPLALEIGV